MFFISYFRHWHAISALILGLLSQGCSLGSGLFVLEEETLSGQSPSKKIKTASDVVVHSSPTGGGGMEASAPAVQLGELQVLGCLKEGESALKKQRREYELLQEDNAALRSHIEYLEQQNSALRVRVGIDSSPGSSETSGSSGTSGPSMISGTSSASGISGTEVAVGVNCGRGVAFGRKEWAQFFNCDVGEEPPLPADIDSILNDHCFFWPNKKVKQTHLLVLIPRRVSGRSFTLNELSKLVRCEHLKDVGTKIWHYDTVVKEALGLQSPTHSYWTLITCDALPLDRYKIDADQNVVLSDSLDEAGYMVPDTLEMATAILAHRIRSDEDIYPEASHSYVRCREHVTLNSPAIVGGMSSSGLQIYNFESFITHHPSAYMGVACSRRL